MTDAQTGEPLPGANVVVDGTQRGTAANADGEYVIINVPVGTHDVRASLVGYADMTKTDVQVSAGRTAQVDFVLSPETVQAEEVVVQAEQDVLHKEVSSSQIVATDTEIIESAGVQSLGDYLAKQPGVSGSEDLEIRGGSASETGTIVNGLALVNERAGQAESSIPLSAIEQVSVQSGGFNAEHGEFRSGLINITTKKGSREEYHGRADLSMNVPRQKRFGRSIYDPYNTWLRPYLDPEVAFDGTAAAFSDDYVRQQYPSFSGWNALAETYNQGTPEEEQVTPLNLYMWNAWMHMVEPPFERLEAMGYEISDDMRQKMSAHAHDPEGDHPPAYNVDVGVGGPVPLVGEVLGDATFYLSHRSSEQYYTQPVTINDQTQRTTMLTLRSSLASNLELTLNGYYKHRHGVSDTRIGEGGYQSLRNTNTFAGLGQTYHWYETYFHTKDSYTAMAGMTIDYNLASNTFLELKLNAVSERTNTPPNSDMFGRDTTMQAQFGPIDVSEMPYNWSPGNAVVDDTQYGQYEAPYGLSHRFANKAGNKLQESSTWQYRANLDFTTQIGLHHQFKTGVSTKYTTFDHEMWWYRPFKNETSRNFTWADRTPVDAGIYVQDQITFEGMVANIGLRADYYRPGGVWPSDSLRYSLEAYGKVAPPGDEARENTRVANVWERWRKIDEENPGFLEPVGSSFALSPRLGISFPVTERSKFYFNYGHFRSLPPARQFYAIAYRPYRIGFYQMGNPRMQPARTISYETGVEYNLADQYLFRLAGYYKDITGESGNIQYISDGGRISYDSYRNNQYQDILGLELSVTKSVTGWLSGWANFDFMFVKEGNTGLQEYYEDLSQREQRGRYEGQSSRFLPQPSFRGNIRAEMPDDLFGAAWANTVLGGWALSVLPQWQAGSYFTWNPLGKLHLQNNMQWPSYFRLDARITRSFDVLDGNRFEVYADVQNVLNRKVSNLHSGNAFRGSGDLREYLATLHLPMYDSEEFETLREQNPGKYVSGSDDVGELRSGDQSYINDPDLMNLWGYVETRDIRFGVRISF